MSTCQCSNLFARELGDPIHPERFSKVFKRHVRDAGLPAIRLHDLRHGMATLALGAGAHPLTVSDRPGHTRVGITLDLYSHVTPVLREELAQQVSDAVFATDSG
ncbi:MAG: tyrosine-type recombinase/integrase [Acidimicrobiia bacterium]|nr:tyrosine-type recombinase/integrase [Acidimicrobiia bacterium]